MRFICMLNGTGSSWLCDILNKLDLGYKAGEWFNPRNQWSPFEETESGRKSQFDILSKSPAEETPHVVVKCVVQQMTLFQEYVFAAKETHQFVFMVRKNLVDQAIAQLLLEIRVKGGTPEIASFDPLRISKIIEIFEKGNTRWRAFFQENELDYYELTYENLQADPHHYVSRIAEQFDGDSFQDRIPADFDFSGARRQNVVPFMSQWQEAMKRYTAGEPWEDVLKQAVQDDPERAPKIANRLNETTLATEPGDSEPSATLFLIITRGRTGSNFLLSLLDSHSDIKHWSEIFGEWKIRQEDLKAEIINQGPIAYIIDCFDNASGKAALGMKMLYYQFGKDYESEWGIAGLSDVLDFFLSDNNLKIIHLKRQNRLKTLVSMQVAGKSQQYALHNEADRIEDIQVELTLADCIREFNLIGQWEREFDYTFRHHNSLDIYYEDLVSDTTRVCIDLLDFLQVPQQTLQCNLLQQNTRPLYDTVKNYGYLKDQFAGTAWSSYFED